MKHTDRVVRRDGMVHGLLHIDGLEGGVREDGRGRKEERMASQAYRRQLYAIQCNLSLISNWLTSFIWRPSCISQMGSEQGSWRNRCEKIAVHPHLRWDEVVSGKQLE